MNINYQQPCVSNFLENIGGQAYLIFKQLEQYTVRYCAKKQREKAWAVALKGVSRWGNEITFYEVQELKQKFPNIQDEYVSALQEVLRDHETPGKVPVIDDFFVCFLNNMVSAPERHHGYPDLSNFLMCKKYLDESEVFQRNLFHYQAFSRTLSQIVMNPHPTRPVTYVLFTPVETKVPSVLKTDPKDGVHGLWSHDRDRTLNPGEGAVNDRDLTPERRVGITVSGGEGIGVGGVGGAVLGAQVASSYSPPESTRRDVTTDRRDMTSFLRTESARSEVEQPRDIPRDAPEEFAAREVQVERRESGLTKEQNDRIASSDYREADVTRQAVSSEFDRLRSEVNQDSKESELARLGIKVC